MFDIKKFLGLSYFVSKLDQFLKNYNKTHPHLSDSQRQEKEKYDRIFLLRDTAQSPTIKNELWDKF